LHFRAWNASKRPLLHPKTEEVCLVAIARSHIRQFLSAQLVDELHLAISPVVLGQGEHLLHGLDLHALGYACAKHNRRDLQS
jgi:dihydrofolate reductase